MANLKETFTKGITTLNVKTNNFMEESKCRTYIATLEGEIKELKFKIGEKTYENWSKNADVAAEVEEMLQKIKSKYEEIDAQKERIDRLAVEEQQILGTSAASAQDTIGVVFCSQCGAQNASNYKFCCKCGAEMK